MFPNTNSRKYPPQKRVSAFLFPRYTLLSRDHPLQPLVLSRHFLPSLSPIFTHLPYSLFLLTRSSSWRKKNPPHQDRLTPSTTGSDSPSVSPAASLTRASGPKSFEARLSTTSRAPPISPSRTSRKSAATSSTASVPAATAATPLTSNTTRSATHSTSKTTPPTTGPSTISRASPPDCRRLRRRRPHRNHLCVNRMLQR